MSELMHLQRCFQIDVLERGTASLAEHLVEDVRCTTEKRLGIYKDAYRIRLREALASNYPHLNQLLGHQAFDSIADGYIDAHRSQHPSIRWYGHGLGSLLAELIPAQPWIGEVAQWEWAINATFDAPDAVPLKAEELGVFSPGDWPQLRFGLHPSVQLLSLHSNAPRIYKALSEQLSRPEATLDGSSWLIWRQELTPRYRSLGASEAAALLVLFANGSFEELCTALCKHHTGTEVPTRAVMLLKEWLSAEMLCSVSL
jgi:hypothetical protein